MSALAPVIKGWCPGALRPMPTGDGLLARVRPLAGRLTLDQAEAVAEAARVCASGILEISSRGNLQLRGVREAALPELWERLARAGLLDADPDVERLRNIVASPLCDIDPCAWGDVAPLVADIEARLASEPIFRALPAKFSFVVDAGGLLPLGDVDADIRFEAFEGSFVVFLGGEAGLGVRLEARDVAIAAARLTRVYVERARGDVGVRRMRALVRRDGAPAIFDAAGLTTAPAIRHARVTSPRDAIGALTLGETAALGVAPSLGRSDSDAFAALTRAARGVGASGFRLTPWRSLIAIGLREAAARSLAEAAEALGFVVSPTDRRLGVVACPGAPACAHALSDTSADALALSSLLPHEGGVGLHVSGCAKGCARASPTAITLVAAADGYEAVFAGRAGDAPAASGLKLAQAAALVKSHGRGLAA